jgi:hypothetical protein
MAVESLRRSAHLLTYLKPFALELPPGEEASAVASL